MVQSQSVLALVAVIPLPSAPLPCYTPRMKKWFKEDFEWEIEVTGFLRGSETEGYCRNGEEIGDKYTCTYGCPVNAAGHSKFFRHSKSAWRQCRPSNHLQKIKIHAILIPANLSLRESLWNTQHTTHRHGKPKSSAQSGRRATRTGQSAR